MYSNHLASISYGSDSSSPSLSWTRSFLMLCSTDLEYNFIYITLQNDVYTLSTINNYRHHGDPLETPKGL